MGASHKKKQAILRKADGGFAPKTTVFGHRLSVRCDLRYFLEAKARITPERFGAVLATLLKVVLSSDEDTKDRILAAKVIVQSFLPKDWHAQWAAGIAEDEAAGATEGARPTLRLLEAVEEIVITARDKRPKDEGCPKPA